MRIFTRKPDKHTISGSYQYDPHPVLRLIRFSADIFSKLWKPIFIGIPAFLVLFWIKRFIVRITRPKTVEEEIEWTSGKANFYSWLKITFPSVFR